MQISHEPDGAVKLTIPEVFSEDGGHYELEASNAGGRTRTGCRVGVQRIEVLLLTRPYDFSFRGNNRRYELPPERFLCSKAE